MVCAEPSSQVRQDIVVLGDEGARGKEDELGSAQR